MPEITEPGGYSVERYEETRERAVQIWKDQFGPNANTASDTPDGHIVDYSTAMVQAVQEQGAAAYQAGFATTAPNVNTLAQIIGPLFGTQPQQATGSKGEVLAFGIVGTIIGQGSVCSSTQGGDRFATNEASEIEQSIWVAFQFGPAVRSTAAIIDLGDQTYGPSTGVIGTGLEVAQTAAGLLTPDAQIARIYDAYEDRNGLGVLIVETNGILAAGVDTTNSESEYWRGSLIPVTSEQLAPIEAEALTITQVDTPAAGDGWKGCANLSSVTLGTNPDTIASYLQQHLDTLGKNGGSTVQALNGALRDTENNPGIEYAETYSNRTLQTDSNGLPPKSFEVIYLGSTGQRVAEIIWNNHPLGIESHGDETYIVEDPDTNEPQLVRATEANELFAWVDVVIVPGDGFPTIETSDLEVQISNNIVALGQSRGVGVDASTVDIIQSFGVTGIESSTVETGFTTSAAAPKPTLFPANIVCPFDAVLRWNTIRISVVING